MGTPPARQERHRGALLPQAHPHSCAVCKEVRDHTAHSPSSHCTPTPAHIAYLPQIRPHTCPCSHCTPALCRGGKIAERTRATDGRGAVRALEWLWEFKKSQSQAPKVAPLLWARQKGKQDQGPNIPLRSGPSSWHGCQSVSCGFLGEDFRMTWAVFLRFSSCRA